MANVIIPGLTPPLVRAHAIESDPQLVANPLKRVAVSKWVADPIRWVTYRLVGRRPMNAPPLLVPVPTPTPEALMGFGSMATVARAQSAAAAAANAGGALLVVPDSADVSRCNDRDVLEQVRKRLDNLCTTPTTTTTTTSTATSTSTTTMTAPNVHDGFNIVLGGQVLAYTRSGVDWHLSDCGEQLRQVLETCRLRDANAKVQPQSERLFRMIRLRKDHGGGDGADWTVDAPLIPSPSLKQHPPPLIPVKRENQHYDDDEPAAKRARPQTPFVSYIKTEPGTVSDSDSESESDSSVYDDCASSNGSMNSGSMPLLSGYSFKSPSQLARELGSDSSSSGSSDTSNDPVPMKPPVVHSTTIPTPNLDLEPLSSVSSSPRARRRLAYPA
jgi:hypothetical protein